MDEALQRAQELVAEWDEEMRREIPEDSDIFDAHLHLGHDIDGMVGDYDDLERVMERYGISHAFMFCMDEPDRHPGFRAPNDRTLEFAERSEGRLIPFVRLDLGEKPIEEATRCLDRGARGIKLHPRAQRFLLDDERLAPVFAIAAERRVPILIHAGRGLPPIAADLAHLVDEYPEAQLILAHAGIADLGALMHHFAGKAGVFFDTSAWSPIDLLDFFRQVSPEQVLYASDFPYGQQPSSLLIALRTARVAGLSDDQIRDMLAGNANRIVAGEPPLEPTAATGSDTFTQPMVLARIHQYLSMATPLLWTRQADTVGVLGLALNACDEQNGSPLEELGRIKELLLCARDMWRAVPEIEDERDKMRAVRQTFRLIHLADIVAVTPGA
ncbi:MAG TPA: amidohydrolase family protein [Gaiellaceae bacterium]|jgi:predicted TIM-barrel fold metal-dependent hydrolase|nr:amidohydrolase family protein [Gaiellaceae bacterium]